MTQLHLIALDPPKLVASTLCPYQHCPRPQKGRMQVGEFLDLGACLNAELTCLGCGRTGMRSVRKDLR